MEIIRKKICLDDYRSRTFGIVPYIEYNGTSSIIETMGSNGNYGGFPINPYIDGEYVNYFDIMRKYHFIMNEYRNGIRLKRIVKKYGEETWISDFPERKIIYDFLPYNVNDFYVNDKGVYKHKSNEKIGVDFIILVNNPEKVINYGGIDYVKDVNENIIGLAYLPSNVKCELNSNNKKYFSDISCPIPGIKMPDYVFYTSAEYELGKMLEMSLSEDPCVLKEWEELGGDVYVNFLIEVKESDAYKNRGALFVEDIIKEDEDSRIPKHIPFINMNISLLNEYNELGIMSPNEVDDVKFDLGETFEQPEKIDYQVESKLFTLRSRDFFTDDNGEYLPGLFQEYNFFPSDNSVAYEVFSLLECVPKDYNGEMMMIKYKNDENNPMKIPFEEYKVFNSYAKKKLTPKAKINVEPNGFLFENSVYTGTFKVNSNYKWQIVKLDEIPNWIYDISPISGYGGTSVTVSVGNNGYNERSSIITFICGDKENNTMEYKCKITQMAKESYISLISGEESIYEINASGGSFTFNFKSTGEWEITKPDWISLNKQSDESDDIISFTATINKNSNSFVRTGKIIVSLINESEKYFTITVNQGYNGSSDGSGDYERPKNILLIMQDPISLADDLTLGKINESGWEIDGKEENDSIMKRTRPISLVAYYSNDNISAKYNLYATMTAEYVFKSDNTSDMRVKTVGTWDIDSNYNAISVPQNVNELKMKFVDEYDNDFDVSFIGGSTCNLNNGVYENGNYVVKWPLITIYPKN